MDNSATDDDLAMRKRRLRFRVWHRGLREVDLLLGRFADARLDDLSDEQITEFENLLDIPDRQVLAWAIGEEPIPEVNNTELMQSVIAFYSEWSGQ